MIKVYGFDLTESLAIIMSRYLFLIYLAFSFDSETAVVFCEQSAVGSVILWLECNVKHCTIVRL